MKKFKELTEGLGHKVPVYHADRKTLVGHVTSGATSIGAAKLAKKKSATFSRVNGEYSWVASGDLKESTILTEGKYTTHHTSTTDDDMTDDEVYDNDGNDGTMHYHDIHHKGKKVGELVHGNYFGDVNGHLHGKRLPDISGYGVSKGHGHGVQHHLDSFLKSQTGKKWAKNIKHLKESKYGDAMSSRLPSHLSDPRWDEKDADDAAKRYKTMPRKGRKGFDYKKFSKDRAAHPEKFIAGLEESNWDSYRERALLEAALDVPTHSPETLAKKHKVSIDHIHAQLKKGIDVEHEHTTDSKVAREIALDHIGELPNYYTKLDKAKLEEELTPREKLSTGERLKPVKEVPVDRNEKAKGSSIKAYQANKKIQDAKVAANKKFTQGLRQSDLKESDIAFNESSSEGYKVGDHVVARFGPHAGQVHRVIHVHSNGHVNIQPVLRPGSTNHYRQGAAKADPRSLEDAPGHGSKKLTEASDEPYKIGDKVVANIGPHKGTVHTVIHVHPTGHLNIKPEVHVRSNRYHLGAAKADPKDVTRHLGESTLLAGREEHPKKHPNDITKEKVKAAKDWGPWGSWGVKRGINSKTVQEAFQAAKDKKNGNPPKVDALPNDGANEPKQEVPGAPGVQPQDAKGPQDGAPGGEKKDNTPKPENPNSKKIQVKGAGPDDQFQAEPIVTPLTTLPDTASPKSGSQGVR